ncbi:MAG: MFS transporter [Actinomycetota bacterium]
MRSNRASLHHEAAHHQHDGHGVDEWLHTLLNRRHQRDTADHSARTRRFVFAGLLVLNVALVFDAAALEVALPSILNALGGDIETVQWVASARNLTFAVFLLPAGRLGDIVGYRRTAIIGGVLFVSTSVIAALAAAPLLLIVARAAQGIGAAIVAPSIVGLTARLYGEERRGRVFGVLIAVLALVGGLAPFFGGVLTETISWRAVFVVTSVLSSGAVAALLLAPRALDPVDRSPFRPDVLGLLVLAAAVLATQLGLIEGGRIGWYPWSIALIVLGAGIGIAGMRRELHRPDGLVDRELLASRILVGSLVAKAISSFGFHGVSLYVVLFLEGSLGVTPIDVGLIMLLPAVVAVFMSPIVGRRLDERNAHRFLVGGLVLSSLGILALALLEDTSSPGRYVMPWLLLNALGYCMAMVPAKVAPLNDLPARLHGRASALLSMASKLWAGFGVAVTAALFHVYSGPSADDAIEKAGLDAAIESTDIQECLGVNDVAECVDELAATSPDVDAVSDETVGVVTATFEATINNTFMTIGVVTLMSSIGVYWLVRPRPTAHEQDR